METRRPRRSQMHTDGLSGTCYRLIRGSLDRSVGVLWLRLSDAPKRMRAFVFARWRGAVHMQCCAGRNGLDRLYPNDIYLLSTVSYPSTLHAYRPRPDTPVSSPRRSVCGPSPSSVGLLRSSPEYQNAGDQPPDATDPLPTFVVLQSATVLDVRSATEMVTDVVGRSRDRKEAKGAQRCFMRCDMSRNDRRVSR